MAHGAIPYIVETQPQEKDISKRVRQLAQTTNQLLRGRSNIHGTVTLTVSAATTTVTTPLADSSKVLILEPTTANAAAELGAGTCYRSATTGGVSFVLTHANNAQADRTFNYALLG